MEIEKLDSLKKEKNFAYSMLMKYINLLKEWQHNLVEAANVYCENQNAVDFLCIFHQYEIIYLNYKNWYEKFKFLKCEVNEYGKSNNPYIQN